MHILQPLLIYKKINLDMSRIIMNTGNLNLKHIIIILKKYLNIMRLLKKYFSESKEKNTLFID